MSENMNVNYDLPILDIIAVFIGVIAIIVALLAIYLTNQTRINTNNTVSELGLSRSELVKIKELLTVLNQSLNEGNNKKIKNGKLRK